MVIFGFGGIPTNFEANGEQKLKLGTPVEIPNSSLPTTADPLPFEYLFSTPT